VGHIRRGNHKRTNKGEQSLGDATPIAPSYIHYAETSTGGLGWIDWIINATQIEATNTKHHEMRAQMQMRRNINHILVDLQQNIHSYRHYRQLNWDCELPYSHMMFDHIDDHRWHQRKKNGRIHES